MKRIERRDFLRGAAAAVAVTTLPSPLNIMAQTPSNNFGISIAGWSLHLAVFQKKIERLDVFRIAREEFGIGAFELVNTLIDKPTPEYVAEIKAAAAKYDIDIPLIMIDGQGALGAEDAEKRAEAVEKHKKWIGIAADLGCGEMRVNWQGAKGGAEKDQAAMDEFIERSVPSYRALADAGAARDLNVVIENHWGPSSYPKHLIPLIQQVERPNFGTLPDFGNFPDDVDRYEAVDAMMPYAKAVSAKCYDFDAEGNDTKIDFAKMIDIVVGKHGYSGNIGIEYEGRNLGEIEGIRACQKLLQRFQT